jgi:cytochrome c553
MPKTRKPNTNTKGEVVMMTSNELLDRIHAEAKGLEPPQIVEKPLTDLERSEQTLERLAAHYDELQCQTADLADMMYELQQDIEHRLEQIEGRLSDIEKECLDD